MSDLMEARPEVAAAAKPSGRRRFLRRRSRSSRATAMPMTTLDQIAERAGVTKGTIYVYFENKEHLFISMVARGDERRRSDTVEDMFERHEGSTADLLRAQIRFIYDHIVRDQRRREIVRMLIAEAARFPAFADRYQQKSICHAWICSVGRSSAGWIAARSAAPR